MRGRSETKPFTIGPSSGGEPAVAAAKRVALVIGNEAYTHGGALVNPHKDADSIAEVLSSVGFLIAGNHKDVNLASLGRILADFAVQAENAEMAAIYYSGHGIEVDGQNYLVPIDAELDHVRRVKHETKSLNDVLDAIEGASTLKLLILDACRDNPYLGRMKGLDRGKSVGQTLADVKPSGNMLIAYAAKHGTKAAAGPAGGNSPFVQVAVEHLTKPGVDIRIVFGRITKEVLKITEGRQEPHAYMSLTDEVCLVPAPSLLVAAPASPGTAHTATHPRVAAAQDWASLSLGAVDDEFGLGLLRAYENQYEKSAPLWSEKAKQARLRLESRFRQVQEAEDRKATDARQKQRKEADERGTQELQASLQRQANQVDVAPPPQLLARFILDSKGKPIGRASNNYDIQLNVVGIPDTVKKVTYKLHRSLDQPTRTIGDWRNRFPTEINAYGDFNVHVDFRDGKARESIVRTLSIALRESHAQLTDVSIIKALEHIEAN